MEDDDWGDSAAGKRSAKQGRRARGRETVEVEEEEPAIPQSNDNDVSGDPEGDSPPRPSRRVGGWGDETSRRQSHLTRFLGRRRRPGDDMEDERLRPKSPERDDDSDNDPDIPVIPDLEEQQEEDITSGVAMAPNVTVNRVATYRELDSELLRHAPFLTLDNEIDLKLLARCLSSEIDVQEEDKPWDWDRLFTEVTSDLLTEYERKEGKEEEGA